MALRRFLISPRNSFRRDAQSTERHCQGLRHAHLFHKNNAFASASSALVLLLWSRLQEKSYGKYGCMMRRADLKRHTFTVDK